MQKQIEIVSNPYRYSTNTGDEADMDRYHIMFQTLIGILQTWRRESLKFQENWFQTLIGILQTALFLALFKLLSSF